MLTCIKHAHESRIAHDMRTRRVDRRDIKFKSLAPVENFVAQEKGRDYSARAQDGPQEMEII